MLFIFDWDGTISDSTAKIVACMKAAASELGLEELPDAVVQNIIGLSLPNAVAELYPSATATHRNELCRGYSAHYAAADQIPSGFFPQVEETLLALKKRGYRLAVATGKSRRGLDRVLSSLNLHDFFDATRCADETESKPSPKMLLELLGQFELNPSQAVMVGDTEFDMEMARRAGVARIGVSYGAHAADRLHQYDLELCANCFSEILHWDDRRR